MAIKTYKHEQVPKLFVAAANAFILCVWAGGQCTMQSCVGMLG